MSTRPSLLARFAQSFFWMGRYMERVENIARLLDVNETFARNSNGEADWLPIVQLQSDETSFFATHTEARGDAVVRFYLLDRDNSTSVISSLWMARQNARGVRHLVSLELWTQLNVFYNRILQLTPEALALSRLSALCATIKEDCQLHTGIVEGTFYRDQGWFFYQIGKYLERADQTTRLLDIKYHRLLTSPTGVDGSLDESQWNAVLRSAAGYHAFRRVHWREMRPQDVAGFLLFNQSFPRSVRTCTGEVRSKIASLHHLLGVDETAAILTCAAELDDKLAAADIYAVLESGLHIYLDELQRRLGRLSDDLSAAMFYERPGDVEATQTQRTSASDG